MLVSVPTIHSTGKIFLLFFCLASTLLDTALSNSPPHPIDCTGKPDGLHEIGCWGYANCFSDKPEIHSCPTGTVLERASMQCVKPGQGNTDCYLTAECSGKADGSYPDYGDKCVTYYRCHGGINLGRFYCPAPTAFNENLQICDYPRNLPPPCGSSGTAAPTFPTTTTARPTTTAPTQTMPTVTTTTTTTDTTTATAAPTATTTAQAGQGSPAYVPPAVPIIG